MTRRRGRNKGNQNNRRKSNRIVRYDNYQQKKEKLYLSPMFQEILKRISDMEDDPIVRMLLQMTKEPSPRVRYNYIHSTKKNYMISYATGNQKTEEKAWDRRNRAIMDLRKFLNKVLKGTANKNQITKFINKYKIVLGNLSKELNINRNTYDESIPIIIDKPNDESILNKILELTDKSRLKWTQIYTSDTYDKYQTKIKITSNKSLLIDLYNMKNDISNFMTISLLKDDTGNQKSIRRMEDDDSMNLIRLSIESKKEE
jgi:hypothetical protein